MLKLYHGKTSVCSAKVRIGLAECGVNWSGEMLDLGQGDQNAPRYLALNPKGVVPTLVDGELVVRESSVILEYVDALGEGGGLMPRDSKARALAGMWLAECIDIHAAINTMTFTTVKRNQILTNKSPAQIEASIGRMANPANATKRRALLDLGLESSYVKSAFFTLRLMFERMQEALDGGPWLLGQDYSIADAALIAYVDRLDRLGLAGFWQNRTPAVGDWLQASRDRSSYMTAIEAYAGPPIPEREKNLKAGSWNLVGPLWEGFVQASLKRAETDLTP